MRTTIRPYLEVTQNLLAQITPGNDVVTYTTLAAGVDATLAGRRTQGQVAVRYERRFVERGRSAMPTRFRAWRVCRTNSCRAR
ncbi:hypothetical protein ACFS32_16865 [Novosphingobium pokkalii]|uniref:hypothetical protein n=1 Tax=Novosphingobium pokkalii TaxID=1770194 RepID=UPI00362C7352